MSDRVKMSDLKDSMDEIFGKTNILKHPQIRFFSGLYPFELLSKKPKDFPEAIQVYPIIEFARHQLRWVFKALKKFLTSGRFIKYSKAKYQWKKGDIVLLPPGLMFRSISPRYYESKNPITRMLVKEYGKNASA